MVDDDERYHQIETLLVPWLNWIHHRVVRCRNISEPLSDSGTKFEAVKISEAAPGDRPVDSTAVPSGPRSKSNQNSCDFAAKTCSEGINSCLIVLSD